MSTGSRFEGVMKTGGRLDEGLGVTTCICNSEAACKILMNWGFKIIYNLSLLLPTHILSLSTMTIYPPLTFAHFFNLIPTTQTSDNIAKGGSLLNAINPIGQGVIKVTMLFVMATHCRSLDLLFPFSCVTHPYSSEGIFNNNLYTIAARCHVACIPGHMTGSVWNLKPLRCSSLRWLVVHWISKVKDQWVSLRVWGYE